MYTDEIKSEPSIDQKSKKKEHTVDDLIAYLVRAQKATTQLVSRLARSELDHKQSQRLRQIVTAFDAALDKLDEMIPSDTIKQ